ncbi:esterase-like activity of phytase family protein [Corynebacterium mastitidis]|uniref:Esterase-like activity of phytase family protein n=1 Tax=Corynebacterium mastitidis TaxID=161890 RepID=A0ABU8NUS0_9CORY
MRFLRSRRIGALLLAAPVLLPLSPAAAQSGAPVPPAFPSQYLGAVDLSGAPLPPDVADALGPSVPFGGISGLERVGTEEYVALSDDSAQHGPARAYRMTIPSDPSSDQRPAVTGATILHDPSGQPYAPQAVDPESVRRLPGGDFAWTSEGWAKDGDFRSPAVILSDASGAEIKRLSVPAYHAPDPAGTRGVRHNKAAEGLAVLGEDTLITANEGALVQDGPMNSEERGMRVRLTHYSVSTGQPLAEYPLEVGALYPGARDRGVSEIIAGGDGSLYIIERGYVAGQGNRGEIYRVTLDGATNVLGKEALDGSETPARKELVFDFASLPEHPNNIEALAWAPRLADGRAQLLVASDDNFSDTQRTLLHRIALG